VWVWVRPGECGDDDSVSASGTRWRDGDEK
jgi:hypothetical protein